MKQKSRFPGLIGHTGYIALAMMVVAWVALVHWKKHSAILDGKMLGQRGKSS